VRGRPPSPRDTEGKVVLAAADQGAAREAAAAEYEAVLKVVAAVEQRWSQPSPPSTESCGRSPSPRETAGEVAVASEHVANVRPSPPSSTKER
jgi:hypothetical protein